MIPISQYIRNAAVEFEAAKALKDFIGSLGKKYRKEPLDQLKKESLDVFEPLFGHGISMDKADEVKRNIELAKNPEQLLRYLSNFMLKGMGLGVLAMSTEDMDKDIITVGYRTYYHPLYKIMKQFPMIKGEFKEMEKAKGHINLKAIGAQGVMSFHFKKYMPDVNTRIDVVAPDTYRIDDDSNDPSTKMNKDELISKLKEIELKQDQEGPATVRRLWTR